SRIELGETLSMLTAGVSVRLSGLSGPFAHPPPKVGGTMESHFDLTLPRSCHQVCCCSSWRERKICQGSSTKLNLAVCCHLARRTCVFEYTFIVGARFAVGPSKTDTSFVCLHTLASSARGTGPRSRLQLQRL